MPFIRFSLSRPIDDAQAEKAKVALGRLISLLEDKDESKLMLEFTHCPRMFFRGASLENGAFVDCRLFGPQTTAAKKRFTEEVFKALEEVLGIASGDVFMQYTHSDDWGSGGAYKTL